MPIFLACFAFGNITGPLHANVLGLDTLSFELVLNVKSLCIMFCSFRVAHIYWRGLGCPIEDVWGDEHCEGKDEVCLALPVRGVLPRPWGEQPHQVHHHRHRQLHCYRLLYIY